MKELHGLKAPIRWPVMFFGGTTEPCQDRFHEGYQHERTNGVSHQSCVTPFMFPRNDYMARLLCNCPTCAGPINHYFALLTQDYETNETLNNYPASERGQIICPNCLFGQHPELADGLPREPITEPLPPFMQFELRNNEPMAVLPAWNDPHENEDHEACWHETDDGNEYCCECEGTRPEDHPDEDGPREDF